MKNTNLFLLQCSLRTRRTKNSAFFVIFAVIFCFPYFSLAQNIGQNYALVIGGLGGEQRYSEKIFDYLRKTKIALIDSLNFPPQNIILLAEARYQENKMVAGISDGETIRNKFSDLSKLITEDDLVFIILYGHGNYDGKNAKLNIPGRDLRDIDYGDLVGLLKAKLIIFINTASSSYSFINTISAPNRIVMTATSSPTQRNFTIFPQYLVEGLTSREADFDRNNNRSILELFRYASEKTNRFFSDEDHLATEFALLDDTGDKKAFRFNELVENNEGSLAAITYLKKGSEVSALNIIASEDSSIIWLVKEKEKIEFEITKLKSQKNQLNEQDYFVKLEKLLINLATINEQIDKKR